MQALRQYICTSVICTNYYKESNATSVGSAANY